MPDGGKTILFAEGEKRLRLSVSASLRTSGYHLIVAGSGGDAMQQALEFKWPIHLLLANVELSDMTGFDLSQGLNKERPDTKVFLVCDLDSGMLVLDHGWQFLATPFAAALLRTRIRDILKEPHPLTIQPWPPEDARSGQETLTNRETQVLKLIAGGNSTKQIAAALGIAFKTSEGHRTRLMAKLSIHDSVTLARFAIRAGLCDA
jgi:FixJ family two-component response regulator